jgi:hypothetical protein
VYEFDVRLSDFVASLAIFEGPPPGNPPLAIDCEATSAFVRVPLDAGTTYYIESANPLGEPPTGDLWFRVTQDPNPLQIDVTLDRTGRVGSTAGTAVVSGPPPATKRSGSISAVKFSRSRGRLSPAEALARTSSARP